MSELNVISCEDNRRHKQRDQRRPKHSDPKARCPKPPGNSNPQYVSPAGRVPRYRARSGEPAPMAGLPGAFLIRKKDQNLILDRMVVRVWVKLQRELINRQIDRHRIVQAYRNASVGFVHLDILLLRWNRKFLRLLPNIIADVVRALLRVARQRKSRLALDRILKLIIVKINGDHFDPCEDHRSQDEQRNNEVSLRPPALLCDLPQSQHVADPPPPSSLQNSPKAITEDTHRGASPNIRVCDR